jgi:hypothetical protein
MTTINATSTHITLTATLQGATIHVGPFLGPGEALDALFQFEVDYDVRAERGYLIDTTRPGHVRVGSWSWELARGDRP